MRYANESIERRRRVLARRQERDRRELELQLARNHELARAKAALARQLEAAAEVEAAVGRLTFELGVTCRDAAAQLDLTPGEVMRLRRQLACPQQDSTPKLSTR